MSRAHRSDVLDRVAHMNPVGADELGEGQRARSEALLASILSGSIDDDVTVEAVKSGHVRFRAGARRWARGLAIAVVGLLGVGGVAYATGVTPTSISRGIEALQKADAGTVSYSYAPIEDGAAVLERIEANAAVSGDLGDPGQVVIAHSIDTHDAWYDDDAQPGVETTDRWDWTLADGIRRVKNTQISSRDLNPGMPGMNMYLEMLPPEGNPLYHPDRRVVGRDIVLGPTARDSARTLLNGVQVRAGKKDWAVIDEYSQHWAEGIGLTASNRAAFVQMLATLNYTYYGPATDREGRTGEAFGVEGRSEEGVDEYRIVMDPDNGSLLAVESVLHGPWVLGSQNHVVSSSTWLSLETVISVPACEDIEGCVSAQEG